MRRQTEAILRGVFVLVIVVSLVGLLLVLLEVVAR